MSRPPNQPVIRDLRIVLLAALLGLTGCLPHGCQRREPSALYSADSLARRIARRAPRDTLDPLWTNRGPEEHPLSYPASIARAPDGDLWVADAENSTLYRFAEDGTFLDTLSSEAFSFPFLGGFRGDTLLVLSRGSGRLVYVTTGGGAATGERSAQRPSGIARSVDLPDGQGRSVAAGPPGVFLKSAGSDPWWGETESGYLTRLSARGDRVDPQVELPGPVHGRRGFLRLWGDSLLSLSGYRPAVDLLALEDGVSRPGVGVSRPGARLDTLELEGFDSPMLARRRAFELDQVDTPPLLTSSAAPLGDHLYVLNLRPRHLRVDVYDRNGRLKRILTEEPPDNPEASDFFPLDLTVYRAGNGALRIAVVTHRPEPAVRSFGPR